MAEGYARAEPFDFNTINIKNKVVTNVSVTTANMFIYGPLVKLSITGLKKSSVTSGWNDMMNLSAYLNPTSLQYGYLTNDSDSLTQGFVVAEVQINTNGMLQIYAAKANTNYWGTILILNR